MKRRLYIIYIGIFCAGTLCAQSERRIGRNSSTPKLSSAPQQLPDSTLLLTDSSTISNRRVNAFRLTDKLGERYSTPMDTLRLNIANSTLMEGKGLAMAYLANLGSAAQSRIFSERNEARDFIFADAYDYYITTPQNAVFYDTKDPYTHLTYTKLGGQNDKEELLEGVLTTNFGKKIMWAAILTIPIAKGSTMPTAIAFFPIAFSEITFQIATSFIPTGRILTTETTKTAD